MREKHDEQERAAIERAALAFKDSTSAVKGLPKKKLEEMSYAAINAYIAARSDIILDMSEAVVGGSLLRDVPGRVPALEPYIERTLKVLTQLDLPWDKPVNQWPKADAVRFISAGIAQALLFEKHTLDKVPFPDNPNGSLEL